MKKFLIFFLLTSQMIFAQEKTSPLQGVRFEDSLSWAQVKAKAKAENKFIFIDGWTTWCSPCIYMNKKVFPLQDVGNFYNKNFINVKLQLDTSDNDNENVKSWYADAHQLGKEWDIQYYPTFVFLNPDGELVHRAVGGSDGATFITLGKDALDPKKQFYTLKNKYTAGQRDTGLLHALAKASMRAADEELSLKVTNEFLATQKNLFTKNNLILVRASVRDVSDKYFKLFIDQGRRVDAILGKGEAMSLVKNLITYQLLLPVLYTDNQPKPKPDWKEAEKVIKEKISDIKPQYLKNLIASIKADHQKQLKGGGRDH